MLSEVKEIKQNLYGEKISDNGIHNKLVALGNILGDFVSIVVISLPSGILGALAKYVLLLMALMSNIVGGLLGALFGGIAGGFKSGWNIGIQLGEEIELKTVGEVTHFDSPVNKLSNGISSIKSKFTKEEDKNPFK